MESSRAREGGEAAEVDSGVQRGLAPQLCTAVGVSCGAGGSRFVLPFVRFPTFQHRDCSGSSRRGHQCLLWGRGAPCCFWELFIDGPSSRPTVCWPPVTPWVTLTGAPGSLSCCLQATVPC